MILNCLSDVISGKFKVKAVAAIIASANFKVYFFLSSI